MKTASAPVKGIGRLGAVEVKTASGDLSLEHALARLLDREPATSWPVGEGEMQREDRIGRRQAARRRRRADREPRLRRLSARGSVPTRSTCRRCRATSTSVRCPPARYGSAPCPATSASASGPGSGSTSTWAPSVAPLAGARVRRRHGRGGRGRAGRAASADGQRRRTHRAGGRARFVRHVSPHTNDVELVPDIGRDERIERAGARASACT